MIGNRQIEFRAEKLKLGFLIAFPTETVYGLGADAENLHALSRLYEVKGRPKDHPVIVHIADIAELEYWSCEIPEYAMDLAKKFWPGPMTLLLKRSDKAMDEVTGGQEIVGIRMPSHPVARELISKFHKLGGHGVAAPSANRFGHVSPTNAEAVKEEIGEFLQSGDVIIDGGECDIGIESTIIDCTESHPRIVRPGAITEAMITEVVPIDNSMVGKEIRVSGALPRHYSPQAIVLLDELAQPGDGLIALAEYSTPEGVIRLAEPKDVESFAHQLYRAFRIGDAKEIKRIVVIQPQGDGLAVAVRDRLKRAAFRG
jgi:L-threonylcarbamoyladenylate synthase